MVVRGGATCIRAEFLIKLKLLIDSLQGRFAQKVSHVRVPTVCVTPILFVFSVFFLDSWVVSRCYVIFVKGILLWKKHGPSL